MTCEKCNDAGHWFKPTLIEQANKYNPAKPMHQFCKCEIGIKRKRDYDYFFTNTRVEKQEPATATLDESFIKSFYKAAERENFRGHLVSSLNRKSLIALIGYYTLTSNHA